MKIVSVIHVALSSVNKEVEPDFYIMDVVLLNGQVFSVLDQFDPSRTILVTSFVSDRINKVASTCGFYGVLPKPISGDVLKGMLESLRLKALLGPQSLTVEVSRLLNVYPRVFNILARNFIDGNKVQKCVEIIGQALNATVVVTPFEQGEKVSFPLFAYFKDESYVFQEKVIPKEWLDRLKKGEIVGQFVDEDLGLLTRTFGSEVKRVLLIPIASEELGNWGFLMTYDNRPVPYTKEEIEFVKGFSSVLTLALLRLKHNTTLEHVLKDAISRARAY